MELYEALRYGWINRITQDHYINLLYKPYRKYHECYEICW